MMMMINTLHNEPDTVTISHDEDQQQVNTTSTKSSLLWMELQSLNDTAAAYLEDGFVDEARRVLLQAAAKLSQCRAVKKQLLKEQQEEADAHLILQESDSDSEHEEEEVEQQQSEPRTLLPAVSSREEEQQQQQQQQPEDDGDSMQEGESVNDEGDDNASRGSMSQEGSLSSGEDDSTMMSDSPMSVDPEELPDFYPYPFTFHLQQNGSNGFQPFQKQQQGGWLTGPQYKICSMTVLFNLGLCSHLAWDDEPLKTGRLQQALYFYEKAILLVLEPNTKNGSFGLEAALIQKPGHLLTKLTLALGINIAQCRTELVQYDKVPFWSALIQTLVHAQGADWHDHPTTESKALQPFLAKHQQRMTSSQNGKTTTPQLLPPEISSPAA